jgi:hypothetical protein
VQPSDPAGTAAGSRQPAVDPQTLLAQLGSEVAGALSSAAERVGALAASGRIGRIELRALRDEIERARRAAIVAQQVSRLASGRVSLVGEGFDLAALLREAVRQRAREIGARGIEMWQLLTTVDVRSDPTLLFALLQAVLDWSFEHACSRIDLTVKASAWPAQAELHSSFDYRGNDETETTAGFPDAESDDTLDTVSWHLVRQTAAVLGLGLRRRDAHGRSEMVLEFPATLAPSLPALADATPGSAAAARLTQALSGHHVLALAARREVCSLVREALRPLGAQVDLVDTVDEARQLCAGTTPQAVVYEASLAGEAFEQLRAGLLAAAPRVAFVRIVDEGRAFELVNAGGRPLACVGRDGIIATLPSALLFELTRLA